mmetsp:Transcript_39325/g.113804  ORF Transcript_39325/g.113804 Transcript_39325/m.113804 type:complete len:428 (-) Transcript_39325:1035-2318(-)
MEASALDDNVAVHRAAVGQLHAMAIGAEALDLADFKGNHTVEAADVSEVRHTDGVRMRLKQALGPTIGHVQARVLVALSPTLEANHVPGLVRHVELVHGPDEREHVNPLRACCARAPAEDRHMLGAVLDGSPQVLERERPGSDDEDALAPELQVPQFVRVAVADIAAEQLLALEYDIPPLADAPVDGHEDELRTNLVEGALPDRFDRDNPSIVWLLLRLQHLPTTPRLAVGPSSADCVDVPQDVVPRGMVLVRPCRRPLLVHDAVAHLGGVHAGVDVCIIFPDAADRVGFLDEEGLHADLREFPRATHSGDAGARDQRVALLGHRAVCGPDVWQHTRVINVLVEAEFRRNLLHFLQQRPGRGLGEAVAHRGEDLSVLLLPERDGLEMICGVLGPCTCVLLGHEFVLVRMEAHEGHEDGLVVCAQEAV